MKNKLKQLLRNEKFKNFVLHSRFSKIVRDKRTTLVCAIFTLGIAISTVIHHNISLGTFYLFFVSGMLVETYIDNKFIENYQNFIDQLMNFNGELINELKKTAHLLDRIHRVARGEEESEVTQQN